MTLNPLEQEFWDEAARNGWGTIAPLMLDVLFSGAKSGHAALPALAQPLVDWDLFNRDAIDWLRRYRGGIFAQINETTRLNVVGAIEDWIKAGDPLPVLESTIGQWFTSTRATTIAVTEVTRAYAEGNKMAWRSTGLVGGKRWNTAMDDRVCIYCGPLNGKIVSIENAFYNRLVNVGIQDPPAHPRCRCWLTPVLDEAAFNRQLEQILGLNGQ